jgi:signal transduction histidine kinase
MSQRQEKTPGLFQEFDALASMSTWGVLLLDRSVELQFASSAACLLLGEKNLVALKLVWPAVQRKLELSRVSELKKGDDPLRYRMNFTTATGMRALRLEVYSLEHKGCENYLALLKDRHALDEPETQFLLASQLRAQTHRVAAIVHDLNAPINNILLTLELLDPGFRGADTGHLPAEILQRLQRYRLVLREELTRLSRLIRTLPEQLNPAKAPQEEFDLRTVLEEVHRELKHDAAARQIRRSLVNSPTPLPVCGAQDRIRVALFNVAALLIEATSSPGNLSVEASRHQDQAQVIFYCDSACVAAGSIGVLQRLSLPEDGVSMGLFVARLIAEFYDGEIITETRPGSGAGFRVSLPLRPVH